MESDFMSFYDFVPAVEIYDSYFRLSLKVTTLSLKYDSDLIQASVRPDAHLETDS